MRRALVILWDIAIVAAFAGFVLEPGPPRQQCDCWATSHRLAGFQVQGYQYDGRRCAVVTRPDGGFWLGCVNWIPLR